MKILVIAPHPDDEILGVGGTIAKRVTEGHEVYVCIVTKACRPLFDPDMVEKTRRECLKADSILGVKETVFLDFPAVMLESIPRYELNDGIFKLIQRIKPEEVYIPHRGDMQLDHKMVVDATMVALRPKYEHIVKRVYSYETLSETGWDIPNTMNEFIPTVYENITDTLQLKIRALKEFESQLGGFPNPRSIEAIEVLAKYRGSNVSLNAAEAFSLIREIR